MTSSFCSKLKVLLGKNIILMTSDIMSILLEIIFPVIMMFIIICLREAFPIESHTYENKITSIENFIRENSMIHQENIKDTENNFNNYGTFYGLLISPPLKICSAMNNQSKARPLIATIGVPELIKERMINDSLEFYEDINFKLDDNSFIEFDSIEEMENYVKSENYLKNDSGLICFGLKFSNQNNKSYNYSLHFFDTKDEEEGIEDIENNNIGLFDKFQVGPDLNSFEKYKNGAYAYMI